MSLSTSASTLASAALLVAANAAQADITLYTSQASFLAAVTNVGVDRFEDMTASVISPLTRTAGSHSYSMSTAYTVDEFGTSAYDYIHPVASGTSDGVFITANQNGQEILFGGFSNVSAFGGNFFFTSYSSPPDLPPYVALTVFDSEGSDYWLLNTTTTTAGSFFGLVSTGKILSVSVQSYAYAAQPAGLTSIDNLTLAQAVPEPQSYALMLGGLGLMGFLLAGRRSRRAD